MIDASDSCRATHHPRAEVAISRRSLLLLGTSTVVVSGVSACGGGPVAATAMEPAAASIVSKVVELAGGLAKDLGYQLLADGTEWLAQKGFDLIRETTHDSDSRGDTVLVSQPTVYVGPASQSTWAARARSATGADLDPNDLVMLYFPNDGVHWIRPRAAEALQRVYRAWVEGWPSQGSVAAKGPESVAAARDALGPIAGKRRASASKVTTPPGYRLDNAFMYPTARGHVSVAHFVPMTPSGRQVVQVCLSGNFAEAYTWNFYSSNGLHLDEYQP